MEYDIQDMCYSELVDARDAYTRALLVAGPQKSEVLDEWANEHQKLSDEITIRLVNCIIPIHEFN